MRRRARGELVFPYMLPAAILVVLAELVPVLYTTYLGFTEWNAITPPRWVGLSNYLKVFSTPELLNALENTALWVGGTLLLAVAFPLLVAVLISHVRLQGLFKTIFFIPSTLAPTIAALFWKRTLSSQQGALQPILALLGISVPPIITNPHINTFVMIGIGAWQYFGLNLILFLVGLETVPSDPREAALLDGANAFQTFRHITFPLLRPITLLVAVNAVINSIRTFDIPWVIVQGGPGRLSETLAISLYKETFLLFRIGVGSAIAVVISAFSLLASYRYLTTLGRKTEGTR